MKRPLTRGQKIAIWGVIAVFVVGVGGWFFAMRPSVTTSNINIQSSTVSDSPIIGNVEGSVYFDNQPSSSLPVAVGEIDLNSSSIRATLNDIYNLTPVLWTPPGQVMIPELIPVSTSTLGADGLYHSVIELDILMLPGAGTSTFKALTPPNGGVCDTPSLSRVGTLLGGPFTGRADFRYKINCVSNVPFTSSTQFQLNYYNATES